MDRRRLLFSAISHGKRMCTRYFDDLIVEIVESEKAGWAKIKDKPSIWAE